MFQTIAEHSVDTIGVGAGAGVGFFFVKWFFEFVAGRLDRRADMLDAGTEKLIRQLQEQVQELRTQHRDTHDRLEKVEGELAHCLRKHAESDAEVTRLKSQLGLLTQEVHDQSS